MKRLLLFVVLFTGCFVFAKSHIPANIGTLTKDQFEDLQDKVGIGGVNDDIDENDAGEDCLFLKFYTNQPEKSEYKFRVRVFAELTDKKTKEAYWTKFSRSQSASNIEYTGEDNWEFILPLGNLEKPRLTAYVIQFGILQGANFVVLAEETDHVDSADEITARASLLEQKAEIKHAYSYRDVDGEVQTTPFD